MSLTFPPLALLFLVGAVAGAVAVLVVILVFLLIVSPGGTPEEAEPSSWTERVKASKLLLNPIRLPLASALSFSAQCCSLGFLIALKSTAFGFGVGSAVVSGALSLTRGRWTKLNATLRFVSEVCGYSELITVTVLSMNSHITHIALQTTLQGLQLGEHMSAGGIVGMLLSSGFWGSIEASTLKAIGHTKDLVLREGRPVAEELSIPGFFAAVSRVKEEERERLGAKAAGATAKGKPTDMPKDVADYVGFALGTYGEKGLKFLSIIPYGSATSNIEAFLQLSRVPSSLDVISSDFEGGLYSPGFVLSVNRADEAVVLAVRGTLMPHDFLTDLICHEEKLPPEFRGREEAEAAEDHFAHSGMLESARNLSAKVLPLIQNLLSRRKYKNYKVVLTGHSLGAGVAGLMTAIWKASHPQTYRRTHCYGYGMPAILTASIGKGIADRCTSVIIGGDMVPRFSLRSFRLLRDGILNTLSASRGSHPSSDRSSAQGMPVLLPAGRVLWVDDAEGEGLRSYERGSEEFNEMPMTVCSFEAHMPQNYGRVMRECGKRARMGDDGAVERSRSPSFFG